MLTVIEQKMAVTTAWVRGWWGRGEERHMVTFLTEVIFFDVFWTCQNKILFRHRSRKRDKKQIK